MPLDISITGLKETQQRIDTASSELHGRPMEVAMRRAALAVEASAKRNAPVDTGRLRASIASEVRVEGTSVTGVVGSNVVYAAAMENGARPHWMPPGAIDTWARRHGMNPFLVARSIARKGIVGRKYLQRAFDSNKAFIIRTLGEGVQGVVRRANGSG